MTPNVTSGPRLADTIILPAKPSHGMHCEFCETPLSVTEQPENLALLGHVRDSEECGRQYDFLLENLRASWTSNMSGG